jgi:hypothetical protein
MKSEIVDLGMKIRSIYEQGAADKFALFMGSFEFPKNSCEGASRVFAHIVNTLYPSCEIHLVEGCDHPSDDRHYWVLVDGLVYDLTCDQFEGFSTIILGNSSNPLSKKFSPLETFEEADIFQNWSVYEPYNKLKTLDYVKYSLARI